VSHTIIHFEIPTDDIEKMKNFYQEVFGWEFIFQPDLNYYVFHTVPTDEKGMLKEPGVNGGLYKRTEPNQVPINYVRVESVDEFVEKVV
jgi:predicted enzyme related to lactoylglutathione lyase